MSSVEISELRSAAPLSLALRNIFLTLTLTVSTLAITGFLWREAGYEMLIVTMGWPHVILGFVFYFGRVLRGEGDSRTSFLLLTAVTLVLWAIHYRYSITGLIYLYFLFHLFRDEIFVYLQTRAGHQHRSTVYAVAGLGPLILLLLLIPKQQDFRQDMRRVEFTGAEVSSNNWTLIPFRPVSNSSGRTFYFYLQAPHTPDLPTFITYATRTENRNGGEVLVGDLSWPQAKDLVFLPNYGEDPPSAVTGLTQPLEVPVQLTGGHRVGQTFTAERNNLTGIWLPINKRDQSEATRFVFHLASPPLLPYSEPVNLIRDILMVIMSVLVLWRLIPGQGRGSQLWVYLAVLAGSFAITQTVLKASSNAGYPFPLLFQFAVVFHYWSWYVFSFDKLRGAGVFRSEVADSAYEKVLGYLRRTPYFALTVVVLNVVSGAGVFWYYRLAGPSNLAYFFDYNYFLYILVFHVTFSFKPRLRQLTAKRL